jgi:5-methylcytosine-specific restriction endonuclease McrA
LAERKRELSSNEDMSRELPEWIGKNDNEQIPPRVRVRIFERFGGRCNQCGIRIVGKVRPAFDHIIAIINGGSNRESNIQLLCAEPCHGQKTKSDVAAKSISYRKKLKAIGIKKPRKITRWRRFSGEIVHASRDR